MKNKHVFFLSFLLLLSSSTTALAEENGDKKKDLFFTFDPVIVIAPIMTDPLTVATNPKAPRQPVPAADGGGYLKNIPGFSATRKGGTASDPVFRGLGGTRLNILLDGTNQLGGCPARMDPTTSYAFPESYDKITVLKGPESVLYGGGNVAGTVLFQRETPRFTQPQVRLNSSLLFGNFGRNDQLLDITAGDPQGFVRIIRTRSDSDNYKDGAGKDIHSFYSRNSLTGIVGWTPDDNTRLEISADSSDAQAAYADRTTDGAQFDRTGYSVRFEKKNLSPLVRSIDFKAYHTYIDHIMDNYSLRPMPAMPMSMDVDRTTNGGRLATELVLSSSTLATVGFDYQKNEHTGNMIMMSTNPHSAPMSPDMTFTNFGIFGDFKHQLDTNNRLLGGLRMDDLDVTYAEYPGRTDNDKTHGAFLRYEHDYEKAPITSYVGIGHAERPADWWERKKAGVLLLTPEKNTQLDTGLLYHSGKLNTSLSLFYSNIDHFIFLTNKGTAASNIDASLYGGEADLTYSLAKHWTATATLAYVRGTNDTSGKPLAQIPPLEGTLGLKYTNEKMEAGLLWRGVQKQNRYDLDNGNEIGYDLKPSGGFGILSANVSYRPTKQIAVSAGIDNIFNKNYAEFISRTGVAIASLGIPISSRVNEPGRTVWVKTSYNF